MTNAELYIKQGDKIYKSGGGSSGLSIIKANSREELPDPSTVAEGTVALVPSVGGGGLPVVELETNSLILEESGVLSEADAAKMDAVLGSNVVVVQFVFPTDTAPLPVPTVMTKTVTDIEIFFAGIFGFTIILIVKTDEGWAYLRVALPV